MNTQNILNSLTWGLFKKNSKEAIPLKSLDISIKIVHNIARVFYSQIYYNDSDALIETEFFFPISPDACFDSFEATFNNTTIKGVIKEKEKAKEEYKEAVEQGKTAAYSEINEETGDVMKVQIGNIPQKTDITITYSYIQKLETSLNKFWCFRLFSTITPRYNGNLNELIKHDISLLANYPTVSKDSKNAYPWKIEVEIQSPSPIKFLKSPSHDIIKNFGNENHTCTITFNPAVKAFPNKDFILLYSNAKEDKVDYTLTPFEDGYCAMVSLFADFDKLSEEEAFENFAKAKQVSNSHAMTTVRGEYIFLIDRSGSMEGDRITMAKESLILFLKSLPKDAFFNVVSFGSSFSFLKNGRLEYSQDNIDDSINHIKRFSADMGGTEILHALRTVFNMPEKKGYPRSVFLLTDGAVSNTQKVLELIQENSSRTRVFTIGIGNGCSPQLITKGAEYGRGKAEFVAQNDEVYEKVISLLNASLSPCYFDISLQGANFDAVVKSVSPNPANLPYLLNGQTLTVFLMLREAAFSEDQKWKLQLRLYDSRIQDYRTVEVTLDADDALKNELIPKLAIYDMIKRLETQKGSVSKEESDVLWMEKEDLKQAMVEYSIKYGILCKETAFFCVVADEKANEEYVPATKVVIPTTLSEDYGSVSAQLSSVQSVMNKSIANILTRGERLDEIMCKSQDLSAQSMMFYKKSKSMNKGSVFGSIASGISSAIGSLGSIFTAKKARKMNIDEAFGSAQFDECEVKGGLDNLDDNFTVEEKKQSKSSRLYLDVVMEQKLEGYWDPKNIEIKKKVLKSEKLPEMPLEINMSNAEMVWLTILVLVWLETVCKEDQKAWALVHQKGCEWLKAQGVDYEQVKEFGVKALKA